MDISANDILKASREEKLELLDFAINDEDRFFHDFLPILKQLLNDEDEEVRLLAVTGLWDYPNPEVIDKLFDMIYNDPSQEVRSKAIVTLGRFIYEGIIADYDFAWPLDQNSIVPDETLPKKDFLRVKRFLLNLFRDENQPLEVRRFAVEALSFLNEPQIVEIIRQTYEHPDPKMKLSAIFSMGRNNNRDWADILLEELESPNKEIQFEATRAAGDFVLPEAAPILKRFANSDDKDLALEAIWALGKVGGPDTRLFLEEYAESDDPDISEVAEAALDELTLLEMTEDFENNEFDDYLDDDWDEDDEDEI